MSKLGLNRSGLFWLGWSSIAILIAAKPAVSQVEIDNHSSKNTDITSLPTSKRFSTRAIDLLSPVELPAYFSDLPNKTYKLGQSNLEQFCRDYPYNSKCAGTTPDTETDSNSIPVPVPPPAPPEESPVPPEESSSDGQKSGWAIVPEISTLGLGGQVVKKIIPQINARVGINGFSLGLDGFDTDIDYEGDLNLFNVSTLFDIHPLKSSGLRLSGGFIFGDNNFEGSGDVSELVVDGLEEEAELDENIINTLREIDGLANVSSDVEIADGVSPYLGIGGGNAVGEGKGFGFWWNLGVVFSGTPDINLDTELASEQVRERFDGSEFEAEVDRIVDETENSLEEVTDGEEDEIQDSLDFVDIYPVLSLGISYQF